jgi:hypothetical protein
MSGDDHIEISAFKTKNGVRVSCVYLVVGGVTTEAHLVFPDGREIHVAVEAGTSTRTLDKALQQIADEQN